MADYIAHFLIGGLPAALVFACFAGYRRRALDAQHLTSGVWREAGLYLFVVCLFGLAAMVLWPPYRWVDGNLLILNARSGLTDGVNWVPLRMILGYIGAFETGNLFYAVVFLFGNMGTFMPLGFFPALLFRKVGAKQVFLLGLGYSLSAEVLQFFLGRHCDVDDVILNVLGALCGYWVYLLLTRLFPALVKRFRCIDSN